MDEHQHEHQCSSQTFLPGGAPHPIDGLIAGARGSTWQVNGGSSSLMISKKENLLVLAKAVAMRVMINARNSYGFPCPGVGS